MVVCRRKSETVDQSSCVVVRELSTKRTLSLEWREMEVLK